MAGKDQDRCYRTFDGVRWPNYCDMWGGEEARIVADAQDRGARFKFRKHPAGFRIAFIHPDDRAALTQPPTGTDEGAGR